MRALYRHIESRRGLRLALMPKMTQVAYAKLIGVTPQYVNKLVSQGKIKRVGKLIDSAQANAAIKAFQRAGRLVQPRRAQAAHSDAGHRSAKRAAAAPKAEKQPRYSATRSITEARAEREHYQALAAKLDYETATGKLLPRDQVLAAERQKNENIRTMLRQMPRSLAPMLARLSGPAEVERALREEIDVLLARLADDPLGMKTEAVEVAPPVEVVEAPPIAPLPPQSLEASL